MTKHNILLFLILLGLILSASPSSSTTIVWHRSPLDFGPFRYEYDIEVMRLALEKTRATHGDYLLQSIPPSNAVRMLYLMRNHTYPNLLMETTYDNKLDDFGGLTYISFPIDFGIIGYRVCFVNPAIKEKIRYAQTLDDLRQYTIGQGVGWTDIEILRHNGFQVMEVSNYSSMFKMIAGGRFDLLCRGANELMMEYEHYKHIGNLTYDDSFALVYSLPRFLYLSQKDEALKQRMEEGLKIAYHDGSLFTLWHKYNWPSIKFTRLHSRKFFILENPLISKLPGDYRQYDLNPLTLAPEQ